MSKEEKGMLSGEKPALIWPEEDLFPLKQKLQTGKQRKKGNNRPRLPPEFKRQLSSKLTIIFIVFKGRQCNQNRGYTHWVQASTGLVWGFPNSTWSDVLVMHLFILEVYDF